MKRIAVIAGLALSAGAAPAQQLSYVGLGSASPEFTFGALELWGQPGQYAAMGVGGGVGAPDFLQTLLSRSSAALAPFGQVEARFGYDAAATPLGSAPEAAWYAADDLHASLRAAEGTVVSMSSATVALVQSSANMSGLTILPNWPRLSGPLPGASFSVQDAAPLSGTLDLAAWLRSDVASGSGFDLGGITQLPVRFTSARHHAVVSMSVFAYDFTTGQTLGLGLPNPLEPAAYNNGLQFGIELEGLFEFAAHPADYATTADFERARAWVDANVRQLDFYVSAVYRINELTVSSVPEPTPAWLLSAGALLLAWRTRSRANS